MDRVRGVVLSPFPRWLGKASPPAAARSRLESCSTSGDCSSLAYLAVAALGQIDLFSSMLEVLGDDTGDVGLFTAASTLAWAPALLFSPAAASSVSERIAGGWLGRSRRSPPSGSKRSLSLSFMIRCPLVVGAQVGGEELLALFDGPRFAEGGVRAGPARGRGTLLQR